MSGKRKLITNNLLKLFKSIVIIIKKPAHRAGYKLVSNKYIVLEELVSYLQSLNFVLLFSLI
jgi:hypothetical protein